MLRSPASARPARALARRRRTAGGLLVVAMASAGASPPVPGDFGAALRPDAAATVALGQLVWRNEGGGQVRHLTWWNRGEEFASLGIGHFIWYPAGRSGPFRERFPALIAYLSEHGVAIPPWLSAALAHGCPWPDRQSFLAAFDGPRLSGLRALLAETVALQSRFVVSELAPAVTRIVSAVPTPSERGALSALVRGLAASPEGLYAMVDYLNFKGEGTDPAERYQGHGWGLLQVLQAMRTLEAPGPEATPAARFAAAAEVVLTRRVALSPPERRERRWLPGWRRRLATYRGP